MSGNFTVNDAILYNRTNNFIDKMTKNANPDSQKWMTTCPWKPFTGQHLCLTSFTDLFKKNFTVTSLSIDHEVIWSERDCPTIMYVCT